MAEIGAEEPREIPNPNIDSPEEFDGWLNTYVTEPLKGFDDKTHEDGTPFNRAEQIEATKDQFRNTREDFLQIMPKERVTELLKKSVQAMFNQPPQPGPTSESK